MAELQSLTVDGRAWTEIADLELAGPDDHVFIISGGSITFGDGVHGRRPPAGATVEATYRDGRGEAGNVRVSIAVRWPPPDRQLLASCGRDGRIALTPVGGRASAFAGVKRVRYFSGQLLTADDFRDEQDYVRHKRWLHDRALHGTGVVSGLRVSLAPDAPQQVVVGPGLALDAAGREVVLSTAVRLTIREDHSPQVIVVQYGAGSRSSAFAAGFCRDRGDADRGGRRRVGVARCGPIRWRADWPHPRVFHRVDAGFGFRAAADALTGPTQGPRRPRKVRDVQPRRPEPVHIEGRSA